MRRILVLLLLAVPLCAQTKPTPKRGEPLKGLHHPRQHSATVEIPAQGFMSRIVHGERWYTRHVEFPANERCFPAEKIPVFWAEEMEGRYLEIRLDNPSGNGVDVSAPQGRTIYVSWSCRP